LVFNVQGRVIKGCFQRLRRVLKHGWGFFYTRGVSLEIPNGVQRGKRCSKMGGLKRGLWQDHKKIGDGKIWSGHFDLQGVTFHTYILKTLVGIYY